MKHEITLQSFSRHFNPVTYTKVQIMRASCTENPRGMYSPTGAKEVRLGEYKISTVSNHSLPPLASCYGPVLLVALPSDWQWRSHVRLGAFCLCFSPLWGVIDFQGQPQYTAGSSSSAGYGNSQGHSFSVEVLSAGNTRVVCSLFQAFLRSVKVDSGYSSNVIPTAFNCL